MGKAERFLIVKAGAAEPDVILWDGETPLEVDGELVAEKDYRGPVREQPVDPEVGRRRTREDAARTLRDQLVQDRDALQALASPTVDQRRQLRTVRACLVLMRLVLAEDEG